MRSIRAALALKPLSDAMPANTSIGASMPEAVDVGFSEAALIQGALRCDVELLRRLGSLVYT